MPVTPPPPSPPAASPPTSPQLHQQVNRHQEHLERQMGSPEQRRIPSTSTTPFLPPQPPPPPISAPVTFNGQSYNHLPADIVSGIRQLQPFPILTSRQHTALPVISFHFFPLLYYAKCHLIQIPPPPPPAVASGSAFGSSSVVPPPLGPAFVPTLPLLPPPLPVASSSRETLDSAQLRALYVPLPAPVRCRGRPIVS